MRPKKLSALALATLVAFSLALARPLHARAENGGSDNAAVAVNTKDNSSVFKLAFSITRVAGDVVDQTNTAVAYASCNSCTTVAIAIQIVLVTGTPSVITPTNLAVAVNENCTLCVTVASAYQFVVGRGEPLTFTHEGKDEIKEIRKELKRLEDADLSADELRARIDELIARLQRVLQTELVARHGDEDDKRGAGDDGQTNAGEAETGRGPPAGQPPQEEQPSTMPTTTETTPETAPSPPPPTTPTGGTTGAGTGTGGTGTGGTGAGGTGTGTGATAGTTGTSGQPYP